MARSRPGFRRVDCFNDLGREGTLPNHLRHFQVLRCLTETSTVLEIGLGLRTERSLVQFQLMKKEICKLIRNGEASARFNTFPAEGV